MSDEPPPDPPNCPKCGGMLTGDTQRLVCLPPPPGFVGEPSEWSAGCMIVLKSLDGAWHLEDVWWAALAEKKRKQEDARLAILPYPDGIDVHHERALRDMVMQVYHGVGYDLPDDMHYEDFPDMMMGQLGGPEHETWMRMVDGPFGRRRSERTPEQSVDVAVYQRSVEAFFRYKDPAYEWAHKVVLAAAKRLAGPDGIIYK